MATARLIVDRALALWRAYPVEFAYAVLMTMVGVPAIIAMMYVVVELLPWRGALGPALLFGCMLLGCVGAIGVTIALTWTGLASAFHVKPRPVGNPRNDHGHE